ncbi:peptide chain release factor PrfB3, chloroplastic isoform X2 [Punica granatum]|nr:peptide chain release factor PrfB3, chloroplastic isoform X2 [Punica granatum]
MATSALELEEARRIRQEEMIRNYDLWDDPAKSNDILVELADSARAVDALKDLAYKAEEAKLITQLAEMDAINYGLFEQAYTASLDVSKFLDQYEMLKLLKGPYDAEGASMVINAGPGGMHDELWAQQLLSMYLKWVEKQGHRGRIINKLQSKNGAISSATVEFEFDYAYGYLQGEKGVHHMLSSSEKGSTGHEVSVAVVDIVPLFLGTTSDFHIDEEDLIFLCPSSPEQELHGQCRVIIQHVPTGITIGSSGERSHFGNKIKALNRLKARLLIIASEQGVSTISNIKTEAIFDVWKNEVRRYVSHPFKLVKDVKTGIELADLSSVLAGNIEPLIGAHINIRRSRSLIIQREASNIQEIHQHCSSYE